MSAAGGGDSGDGQGDAQRLDKWLWCARFFKSRTLANAVLSAGRLRLSGVVVGKAHQRVKVGDVLTFPQGPNVRVVKVLSLAVRRGPAAEAQDLYEDLAPVPERRSASSVPSLFMPTAPARDRGAGRPTKKDRRAVDRFSGDEQG